MAVVSISESRCFSFQAHNRLCFRQQVSSFNLGIEMLFISSTPSYWGNEEYYRGVFQSRNRDAFHFKVRHDHYGTDSIFSFNLGIEMFFISSRVRSTNQRQ